MFRLIVCNLLVFYEFHTENRQFIDQGLPWDYDRKRADPPDEMQNPHEKNGMGMIALVKCGVVYY